MQAGAARQTASHFTHLHVSKKYGASKIIKHSSSHVALQKLKQIAEQKVEQIAEQSVRQMWHIGNASGYEAFKNAV